MGRSLQTGNSLVVSTFHTALFHQLLFVLLIVVLSAIAFNIVRTVQYRRLKEHGLTAFPTASSALAPEPLARRVLRIGFGCLWVLDGLLQIQSSMPLGLPSGVIEPSAGASPTWVQHLVNSGVTIWSDHPVEAAAATVWIQLGLGVWLLVAPRGRWSRLGGAATAAWGLLVWMFGEAFGGIFAPGLTWVFGAPGAVVFYCAAGILIALPERAFSSPRLGRMILGLGGLFLIGMAILQAWPGRGFWQGRGGTLDAMVHSMSQTSQPAFLSSWLVSFALVRRGPRMGRQPLSRGQPGRHRRTVPHRPEAIGARGDRGVRRAVARRLGARGGPRLPRRPGDRPELDAAHGLAVRCGLPGHGTPTRRCRGAGTGGGRRRGACTGPVRAVVAPGDALVPSCAPRPRWSHWPW